MMGSVWCDCECGYVPAGFCFGNCAAEEALQEILAEAQAMLPTDGAEVGSPKVRQGNSTKGRDEQARSPSALSASTTTGMEGFEQ